MSSFLFFSKQMKYVKLISKMYFKITLEISTLDRGEKCVF